MEITDVRVRRIATEGKLRAYATITFDNQFVIHNLKVIDGKSGLFVAMPSRKTKSGEFKDVAHPISSDSGQPCRGPASIREFLPPELTRVQETRRIKPRGLTTHWTSTGKLYFCVRCLVALQTLPYMLYWS